MSVSIEQKSAWVDRTCTIISSKLGNLEDNPLMIAIRNRANELLGLVSKQTSSEPVGLFTGVPQDIEAALKRLYQGLQGS